MRALLLPLLLLSACPSADPCEAVCPAAGPFFERCMEGWGLGWGQEVGYADRADWDAWCATVQTEDRVLADSPEAEAARRARCREQLDAARNDRCDLWYGLWDGP